MGKKKHEEHENHERWLVSYADFMTLLFAFFVVLWSSSKADKQKMDAVIHGMQAAFVGGIPMLVELENNAGVPPRSQLEDVISMASASNPTLRSIRSRLNGSLSDHVMEIGLIDNTLNIELEEQVLFELGSADVHPTAYETLSEIADAVRGEPVTLQVIGHADGTPFSGPPFVDNWGLASARSVATIRILGKRGLDVEQLSAAAELTGTTNPKRRSVTFRIRSDDNAPTAGVMDKLYDDDDDDDPARHPAAASVEPTSPDAPPAVAHPTAGADEAGHAGHAEPD